MDKRAGARQASLLQNLARWTWLVWQVMACVLLERLFVWSLRAGLGLGRACQSKTLMWTHLLVVKLDVDGTCQSQRALARELWFSMAPYAVADEYEDVDDYHSHSSFRHPSMTSLIVPPAIWTIVMTALTRCSSIGRSLKLRLVGYRSEEKLTSLHARTLAQPRRPDYYGFRQLPAAQVRSCINHGTG